MQRSKKMDMKTALDIVIALAENSIKNHQAIINEPEKDLINLVEAITKVKNANLYQFSE